MKKLLALFLVIAIFLATLVACDSTDESGVGGDSTTAAPTASLTAAPTEPPAQTSDNAGAPVYDQTDAPVETDDPFGAGESTDAPGTTASTAAGATAVATTAAATVATTRAATTTTARGGPSRPDYQPPTGAAQLTGTISISGSTSLYPVVSKLSEAFRKDFPRVTINVTASGSGQGRTDANNNRVSFGMVSAEWTNSNRNQFPNVIPLQMCIDGVALIVHPNNSVTNLTPEQLVGIYRADTAERPRTLNWSGVGGGNNPINAISRESGSGTRDCFQSILSALPGGLGTGYDLHSTASILTSTGAVRNAVAGNPNSIGYVSLANVDSTVKALRYGGVEATRANLQNGSYTLQRPFLLCVNNSRTLNQAEQEFLKFIFSAQGQAIIDGEGLVGMSASGITTELAKVGLRP